MWDDKKKVVPERAKTGHFLRPDGCPLSTIHVCKRVGSRPFPGVRLFPTIAERGNKRGLCGSSLGKVCPMRSSGCPRTVTSLVEEHYESLYRHGYRLSGSAAGPEGLTHETFWQAQQKLAQLRDPARRKPWLFAILRIAYHHRARGRKQHNIVSLNGVAEVPHRFTQPLPGIDPAELQEALNELPEVFR